MISKRLRGILQIPSTLIPVQRHPGRARGEIRDPNNWVPGLALVSPGMTRLRNVGLTK